VYFDSKRFGGVEAMTKPDSWGNRKIIEKKAVDIFLKRADDYGFINVKDMGIEFDDKEIYLELSKRKDRTTVMLKHKPDKIAFTKEETVLLQIKGSDETEYDVFLIEIDSYRGAMEWNKTYRHTAFVFVINPIEEIKFIWADEITFDTIFIPKRFDWKEQKKRLEELYPEETRIRLLPVTHKHGSGTPYISIKKQDTHNLLDMYDREVIY